VKNGLLAIVDQLQVLSETTVVEITNRTVIQYLTVPLSLINERINE